ncbi:DIE2/ALG10 family-domain-containing protein [Bisporella sp. PMI_857]|nr:DIE2/ALG10 family-domain-containing protein [Bisporella sp. PMI_857]
MAFSNPITWLVYIPWIAVVYTTKDALSTKLIGDSSEFFFLLAGSLAILCKKWLSHVMANVPKPYMDEVFHIPQAQAYCVGDFHIWDPKLTTPPGLYAFSTYFCNLGGIRKCDVATLRFFNTLALLFTMAYAGSCRTHIARLLRLDANGQHIAFNIALFPPLFFFSGLFYTDILSTCVVLRMYRLFLERGSGVWLYIAGILALTMRQTNIFWAAVFMGGLEVSRTLKSIKSIPGKNEKDRSCWQGRLSASFHQYARGDIHDVALKDAEIYDLALCAISISVAAFFHPIIVLRRISPYVALLISFAAFVFWNGGVVLGDKTAHVATLHLPQLLYLWPFMVFFSLPLIIPTAVSLFRSAALLIYQSIFRPQPSNKALKSKAAASNRPRITPLRVFLTLTTLAAFSIMAFLIIHFNTLIHPYTLADNRHYMFYIFRYSILRHPLIRYLLAPAYLTAFYLCFQTLSTRSSFPVSAEAAAKKKMVRWQNTTKEVTTSWFLIWLISTALSLITAPLVEPRYFILPWVFWRLQVPSYPAGGSAKPKSDRVPRTGYLPIAQRVLREWGYEKHDPRLWAETLWFLAINAATAYIFLHRGFTWENEPGKVQRFMW